MLNEFVMLICHNASEAQNLLSLDWSDRRSIISDQNYLFKDTITMAVACAFWLFVEEQKNDALRDLPMAQFLQQPPLSYFLFYIKYICM